MKEKELLKMGAESLRKAALNEDAKAYILNNKPLYNLVKKAANRYIGGETIPEVLKSISIWNHNKISVTTDFMGESIRNEKESNAATKEFINLIHAIKIQGLNSSVSLDLTHIGLLVSKDLAIKNLKLICEQAATIGQEVILSMEGIDRTDKILEVYKEVLKTHRNLGITLQAYLHRTKDDFKDVLQLPGSIRMVKGAYQTPKGIALERGVTLDTIYLDYVSQLLAQNKKCAIASHHTKIFEESTKLIDLYGATDYVLERLLGIENEGLLEYNHKGYNCRIYIVYGKEWYLYLCNRLAEYPMSVFQAIEDMLS